MLQDEDDAVSNATAGDGYGGDGGGLRALQPSPECVYTRILCARALVHISAYVLPSQAPRDPHILCICMLCRHGNKIDLGHKVLLGVQRKEETENREKGILVS